MRMPAAPSATNASRGIALGALGVLICAASLPMARLAVMAVLFIGRRMPAGAT